MAVPATCAADFGILFGTQIRKVFAVIVAVISARTKQGAVITHMRKIPIRLRPARLCKRRAVAAVAKVTYRG